MNDREKKLVMILVGAAFIIANLFGFTTYNSALLTKKTELKKGESELNLKLLQIEESYERSDEREWLAQNRPADGTHASVRAELVTFTSQSAQRNRINIKTPPNAQPADVEESGTFRSAVVKVKVDCRDAELYRWLCDLQDPKKSRSITHLRISPQRTDKTRVDCELEVTQWFTPVDEDQDDATAAN